MLAVLEAMRTFCQRWADVASVGGVALSAVGFIITILKIRRSQTSAEAAAKAASDVRERLTIASSINDLTQLMNELEELKPLHRAAAWGILPSRYTNLRRQLLAVKEMYPNLSRKQRSDLQGIITQFRTIEEVVERSLPTGSSPLDAPSLNRFAAEQSDKLHAILVSVQQSIRDVKK